MKYYYLHIYDNIVNKDKPNIIAPDFSAGELDVLTLDDWWVFYRENQYAQTWVLDTSMLRIKPVLDWAKDKKIDLIPADDIYRGDNNPLRKFVRSSETTITGSYDTAFNKYSSTHDYYDGLLISRAQKNQATLLTNDYGAFGRGVLQEHYCLYFLKPDQLTILEKNSMRFRSNFENKTKLKIINH